MCVQLCGMKEGVGGGRVGSEGVGRSGGVWPSVTCFLCVFCRRLRSRFSSLDRDGAVEF